MRLIRASDDEIEEIRDLDAREFPGAAFPDLSYTHAFWTVDGDPELGYCGASIGPARGPGGGWIESSVGCVHLTRGYVSPDLRGRGIQARMIRTRLAWGRRRGCTLAQTYTWHDNVPSMRTLARAGFLPLRASGGYIRWEKGL